MTPTAKEQKIAEIVRDIGRTKHYECEDQWYSCPKSEEGCANEYAGTECTCGLDYDNAQLLAACNAVWEAALEHAAQCVEGIAADFRHEADWLMLEKADELTEAAAALRREAHPQQEKG